MIPSPLMSIPKGLLSSTLMSKAELKALQRTVTRYHPESRLVGTPFEFHDAE